MDIRNRNIFDRDYSYRMLTNQPDAYSREDERDDGLFYSKPRPVEHLDAHALERASHITGSLIIENNPVILDMMAGINSHLPDDIKPAELIGLGLNKQELKANPRLTDIFLHDINKNPILPFDENYFDIVLNTVSIQYVIHPVKIFSEVARILKPGGLFLIIFSNRSFPTKSIKVWELLTDQEKLMLVKDHFESNGEFTMPQYDLSLGFPRPQDDKYFNSGLPSDPLYTVYAEKKGGEPGRPERKISHGAPVFERQEKKVTAKIKDRESPSCPHCGSGLHLWKVTDNPWTTWDHDLYVCINDACPYLIRGWKTMFLQGNEGLSYRFVYDRKTDKSLSVPVPNLSVLKDSLGE